MSTYGRVRISWFPSRTPLFIEELSLSGLPLLRSAERTGGTVEVAVPMTMHPPLLRWRLKERAATPAIDEIRIEIRDAAGGWHLVGELLGGGHGWSSERLLRALLPAPRIASTQQAYSAR